MNIGKRIKELREGADIKSGDFARMIDVSGVFLSYIENGTKKPSLDTIEKICKALNISLSQFFSEGEESIVLSPELKNLMDNAVNLPAQTLNLLSAFIASLTNGKQPVYKEIVIDGEPMKYLYDANIKPNGLTEEEEQRGLEIIKRLEEIKKEKEDKK
jgi:transcriptional regulator with XRE-family HTH domain